MQTHLSNFQIWLLASRPKTLPAALSPVLIGTAMAYVDGAFHVWAAFAAALGAIWIQIGTNFVNDYYDFKKGADQGERLGPMRVTQAGLVSPQQMRLAIGLAFGIAFLVGTYLVWRGGWPVVFIGLASILFGFLYTAGPYSLSYLGIADIFVFFFFGPVAVGGTYYVQAMEINWIVIFAGFAPGLLSTAILTVNNIRDVTGDTRAGKKTVAVRFGRQYACYQFLFCVIFGCLIPILLTQAIQDRFYAGAPIFLLYFVRPGIKTVFTSTDGPTLNKMLAQTGLLLLLYSILFSIGWIVGG